MDRKEKKTVSLEFDSRLFELLSKDLYKDDLAFLRELTQNSVDAGATRIFWEIKEEEGIIYELDNGKGMDYEFIIKDWKKLGKSFKKGSKIGMYGIGRLSLWRAAEKVLIHTKNVIVNWNSINKYTVEKTNEFYSGFKAKIWLDFEKVRQIYQVDVKDYLEKTVNLPEIEIRVNGELIEQISLKYPWKKTLEEEKVTVWLKEPKEPWEGIKIYEKGLRVSSQYSDAINCLIDFNKPIKTLSRESLTLSDHEIRNLIRKALKELAKEKLKENKAKYIKEFSKLAKTMSHLAIRYEDKELAKIIPIEGSLLGDFKKFYYSGPSSLVERAKKKGYLVLVVTKELGDCCRLIGMKSLKDIKEKLREEYLIKSTESEKGKRILRNSAKYLEFLTQIVKELKLKPYQPSGLVLKTTEIEKLEKQWKDMHSDLDLVKIEDSAEIKYTLGNLAFGEKDNENVVAFQYGDYTVLNLNNELIKTLIRTERIDLIEEVLTHEFVHRLGYHWHDNKFLEAYNLLRVEALKRKAEFSALFSTKTQVSVIKGKYKQGLIKIPRKVLDRLGIKKGSRVKIELTPIDLEETEESEENLEEIGILPIRKKKIKRICKLCGKKARKRRYQYYLKTYPFRMLKDLDLYYETIPICKECMELLETLETLDKKTLEWIEKEYEIAKATPLVKIEPLTTIEKRT